MGNLFKPFLGLISDISYCYLIIMSLIKIILILFLSCILISCSASYKKLKKLEDIKPINFQEYLHYEYKDKAIFEAEEMHDWNSAKLYSEKALKSLNTDKIYPEEVSHWNIPKKDIVQIHTAYKNLLLIYDDAKIEDPQNLAIAIVALDCWSEQQEENWQTWDINKCKDEFFNSMHFIYKKISKKEKNKTEKKINKKNKKLDLTKKNNEEILQLIYFDFDNSKLSNVSINNLENFLKKYRGEINNYLIVGHTDTKGPKNYNLNLSIKRAEVVKNLLIKNDIDFSKIKIIGKGEEFLAVLTPDDTKHPANRRVEVKKSN